MIDIDFGCAARAGIGFVVGLFASAWLTVAAQAEQARLKSADVRSIYHFKVITGDDVQYNHDARASRVTVSNSDYQRSNPYVCTASGFGQKARCHLRDLSQ
jgi:hypothetical protein